MKNKYRVAKERVEYLERELENQKERMEMYRLHSDPSDYVQ